MSQCSNNVELVSIEKLDYGTTRIMVKIKGILFKRLSNPYYPVVWNDEELTFNNCLAMTPEQEKDLEGIFKAWMVNNNTNEQLLLNK